ncbi:MAG: peptidylprolyl isomerase [Ferruginibacter sp.]
MQIIQTIKDKGGVIMAIFIAIALISFILMDSKSNGNRPTSSNIGKVNGTSIDLNDFNKRVKVEENNQAQQRGGQQPTGAEVLRIRDQVWNQIVAENVFYATTDKLGINLTSKELSSILLSNDQSNPFLKERSLLGEDGKLDVVKAADAINNIKKFKGEQREAIDAQILEPLKLSTAAAKYSAMMSASAYYPTWMQEKDMADEKSFATISYVSVPFNEISDSAVTVKDEDINAYVAKHKDLFKQEAGRTISYITFSQNPSASDSAAAKKIVTDLIAGFTTDTSASAYVARNTSVVDFVDDYTPLARIQAVVKDSMVKYGVGVVSGPFVDGENYSIAKVLGTKQLPDSVKARHILIGINDPQSGAQLMVDSVAKKLADSIFNAIKAGADFGALAAKYSTDGSKTKGGDLGTFAYGQMVPEFNTFCFTKTVGSKEVVKTQFGYHIIDILNQTNFKPAYKIAILAKPILPSDETINAANLAATKAAANKGTKELSEYASKAGLKIVEFPTTLKENDFAVGNMQDARSLVKWAFEAKQGAVSDPIVIGNDFVVATVNKTFTEGTQDASTARAGAEAAVRNQKKGEIIVAKMGATIETAATAFNKQVQVAGADSTITMSAKIINGIGAEPKVIGAIFNKENQTKASAPIIGASGVYVVKTTAILPTTEKSAEQKATQISAKTATIRQQGGNWFEALRKQADIKDSRSKFF